MGRPANPPAPSTKPLVRLDRWLWAARFYKTRRAATEDIDAGRVHVNDQPAKPSREVRMGDRLRLRQRHMAVDRVVIVKGLSDVRGSAPIAQTLYEETTDSLRARTDWLANRHYLADPAQDAGASRPTRQNRRQLAQWQRWSASADDPGS